MSLSVEVIDGSYLRIKDSCGSIHPASQELIPNEARREAGTPPGQVPGP